MASILDSWLLKPAGPMSKWDRVQPLSAIMPTEFSKKICTYLDLDIDKGPWIAGGSVRKAYFNEEIGFSDWDVWFRSKYQYEQAKLKMETLDQANLSYTSENARTYKIDNNIVQLIYRNYYKTVDDLLNSFDLTVCQFATDGLYFKVGEKAIDHCMSKTINYRKDIKTPGAMNRIAKYMVYGYRPTDELLDEISARQTDITFAHSGNEYDE